MLKLTLALNLILATAYLFPHVSAASRIRPSAGSVIVRAGTTTPGEFQTVSGAVKSLPNDNSPTTIFIYPGTYTEQVVITRPGPLTIFGYTKNTKSYKSNTVTIQYGLSANTSGSDDASATLRITKANFTMYNVIVSNTFGRGSQALALSQSGDRAGFYACSFFGFQDTLRAERGRQVYLGGYIEAAVDFIFGRQGKAYFENNMIAVSSAGFITASGRSSDDDTSFVFNKNNISLTSTADSGTAGNVFLGRPWRNYAKVIFKNTIVTSPLNPSVWSIWAPNQPNTDNIFFADFNSTGSGIQGAQRALFSTLLSAGQAGAYSISSAVGSDYATWVDTSYLS